VPSPARPAAIAIPSAATAGYNRTTPDPVIRRTISECIALLPEESTAVMDADFAKDVQAAIDDLRQTSADSCGIRQ
jgi:hypothetical protein